MRDRLIELIEEASQIWDESQLSSFNEVCADHLLANGVIVPPVQVGQTVWCRYVKPVEQGKVSGITQKANGTFKIRITASSNVFEITADFIGKTVFLTREDAEKAVTRSENRKWKNCASN